MTSLKGRRGAGESRQRMPLRRTRPPSNAVPAPTCTASVAVCTSMPSHAGVAHAGCGGQGIGHTGEARRAASSTDGHLSPCARLPPPCTQPASRQRSPLAGRRLCPLSRCGRCRAWWAAAGGCTAWAPARGARQRRRRLGVASGGCGAALCRPALTGCRGKAGSPGRTRCRNSSATELPAAATANSGSGGGRQTHVGTCLAAGGENGVPFGHRHLPVVDADRELRVLPGKRLGGVRQGWQRAQGAYCYGPAQKGPQPPQGIWGAAHERLHGRLASGTPGLGEGVKGWRGGRLLAGRAR